MLGSAECTGLYLWSRNKRNVVNTARSLPQPSQGLSATGGAKDIRGSPDVIPYQKCMDSKTPANPLVTAVQQQHSEDFDY